MTMKLYEQAAAEAAEGAENAGEPKDDVVDADFEEVDRREKIIRMIVDGKVKVRYSGFGFSDFEEVMRTQSNLTQLRRCVIDKF